MSHKRRFCLRNHDTAVTGRYKTGACIVCVRAKTYRLNKLQFEKSREFINSIKRDKPCTDCKIIYHPCQMDFDHLGNKKIGIAAMKVQHYSIKRIQEEINKCELVCANCHRLRTYRRLFPEYNSSTNTQQAILA
jgi:hypothetical protein